MTSTPFSKQAGMPPRYMTQSIALEETSAPSALKTTVNIVAVLMLIFLIWSAFAEVKEVAVAQGQIVPNGHVQTIQHLEGGMVREILVDDGQMVKKGQPLLRLDDTIANADLGQMKARQSALKLQTSRLKAYASDPSQARLLNREEKAILASMEDARLRQQDVLKDQLMQKQKELQGVLNARASLERNLQLAREELAINVTLSTRGSVSRMAVMSSERQVNALEGELESSYSQEKQVKAGIDEAKNRLKSLGADLKKQAMESIGQTEAEVTEIEKTIAKLESASNRTVLISPVDGIVKGLSVHTIGSVVEQGKVLMEIVPVDSEMVVDAFVSPASVGNLKPGQKVNVKVTAYDFSRFGSIDGVLKNISATTFQKEDGDAFYKARIRLGQNHVGDVAGKNLILPGMIVQADIVTGKKTILDYLLKPIKTVTQTALQER